MPTYSYFNIVYLAVDFVVLAGCFDGDLVRCCLVTLTLTLAVFGLRAVYVGAWACLYVQNNLS